MRVIAGDLRGRTLEAPQGRNTRPITDRVKESIFNILGSRLGTLGNLPDVAVLDLFAGSGGFGIECLSRGAATCVFVERDRAALAALRQNLKALKLGERARVSTENIWMLRGVPAGGVPFGLIFVDPPYKDAADPRVADLLERLAESMADDGLVVFRHAATTPVELKLRRLEAVDDRTFGTMRVVLLKKAAECGPQAGHS